MEVLSVAAERSVDVHLDVQQQSEAWEEYDWESDADSNSGGESAAEKRAADTQRMAAERHVVAA